MKIGYWLHNAKKESFEANDIIFLTEDVANKFWYQNIYQEKSTQKTNYLHKVSREVTPVLRLSTIPWVITKKKKEKKKIKKFSL